MCIKISPRVFADIGGTGVRICGLRDPVPKIKSHMLGAQTNKKKKKKKKWVAGMCGKGAYENIKEEQEVRCDASLVAASEFVMWHLEVSTYGLYISIEFSSNFLRFSSNFLRFLLV
jgi:hypothetical protein